MWGRHDSKFSHASSFVFDVVVDFDGDGDLNVAERRPFRATSHVAVAVAVKVNDHEKVLKSRLGPVLKMVLTSSSTLT